MKLEISQSTRRQSGRNCARASQFCEARVARYKHSSIRDTRARGEGRKNVGWFRTALHHFSLPLLPTSVRHHVAAVAASLFPRGASLFAEQGASFQRRCFAFTFPSPPFPSNNDGLHSRTHRVSPRFLLPSRARSSTTRFANLLCCPLFVPSKFPSHPLGTICSLEREGKECRETHSFSCPLLIDDRRTNQLVENLCVLPFSFKNSLIVEIEFFLVDDDLMV